MKIKFVIVLLSFFYLTGAIAAQFQEKSISNSGYCGKFLNDNGAKTSSDDEISLTSLEIADRFLNSPGEKLASKTFIDFPKHTYDESLLNSSQIHYSTWHIPSDSRPESLHSLPPFLPS